MMDPIFRMMGSDDERNDYLLKRINRLQETVDRLNNSLSNIYLRGRLRTNRPIPTSSIDTSPNDLEYDRIVTNSYEYILINNAGTLNWVRIPVITF